MSKRRVVITGQGVFSPVGNGAEAYWSALVSGKSGVKPITRIDVGELPIKAAAEVEEFKPRDYIPKEHRKAIKVMSWDVQMGVAAALSAVEDSRIITPEKRVDPTRLGISYGAGFIASDIDEMGQAFADSADENFRVDMKRFGVEAMKSFFPLWLLKYLPNMPACHVSIFIDAEGPNNSIITGDSSASQAIGEAFRIITRNAADTMVCGGVDGKINPLSLVRYWLLGDARRTDGAPETLSRPFDKDRRGFLIGEGGAALVLEEYEHAKARGAKVLAEVVGFGAGCDAQVSGKPLSDGPGCRVAMKNALKDAALQPADIDALYALARSSVVADAAEAKAIHQVFGADGPLVTSTKSMIGFISAAGGAMDTLAAVGALNSGVLSPNINLDEPDPELPPIRLVGKTAQPAELDTIMVNAGGFGGQYASLILRKV